MCEKQIYPCTSSPQSTAHLLFEEGSASDEVELRMVHAHLKGGVATKRSLVSSRFLVTDRHASRRQHSEPVA